MTRAAGAASAGTTARTTRAAKATRTNHESPNGEVRFVDVVRPEIVPATDLGSVLVLKHGSLYLLSDQFGDIHPDSRGLGLYRGDTRVLSCAALRVNGTRLALLQAAPGATFEGSIEMTNPGPLRDIRGKTDPHSETSLARRTLGIRRERVLAGALRERVRVVNHAEQAASVMIELDLASDDADIFEVRGYHREQRGEVLPIALGGGDRVTFRYAGLDGRLRRTHVLFSEPGILDAVDPTAEDQRQGSQIRGTWRWTLKPGEARVLEWRVWLDVVGRNRRGETEGTTPAQLLDKAERAAAREGSDPEVLFPAAPVVDGDVAAAAYREWARGTAGVDSDNELFNLVVQRSMADLRLLVNDGPGAGESYVAAGVPWFTTLFGRDALITAIQSLAFRPETAVDALSVLAARQATAIDDWRDAEPGKILHEFRTGEMAAAGELPFSPYYGSVDSTPLWLILLGATFEWTGDRELLDRFWPNAMAALRWIDEYGDRDGDGFVEYARRSERGLVNQGWKDSHDSVRDRHGNIAEPPIALAEVQGYVYDAKRRMAHLANLRGDDELADRLRAEADTLRQRFEDAFWLEDRGYYAMALDAHKRPMDAIASNAGQCLWTGIVSPERARKVANVLMDRGLFSGWGIRTYASDQPGYNPIGYHTGTVWPHDTSLIAAGLKRYGFHDEANELISRVLEAAQRFPAFRLPELFCGFDRDSTEVPVPYPVACSPQAWAAGAPFLFLTTMLGLVAHGHDSELELRKPQLPGWIKSVRLTNVRIGEAVVDLLFHSWRGTTSAEVLRKVGDVSVTIRL